MDIGLFIGICLISLGVAAFGMLVFSLGLVIRAKTRLEDARLKWDFLDALRDADKNVPNSRPRDNRIQTATDYIQPGDAS